MSKQQFSLAISRPGAYFNDGEGTCWVQHEGGPRSIPSQKLIDAVKAGKKAFFESFTSENRLSQMKMPDAVTVLAFEGNLPGEGGITGVGDEPQ